MIFLVTLRRLITRTEKASIEVDADSAEEAEKNAEHQLLGINPQWAAVPDKCSTTAAEIIEIEEIAEGTESAS